MLHLRTFGGLSLENGGRPIIGAAGQRRRLALLAVLDTATMTEASRTAARLDRYYTLTDRFAAQLRESERAEYLAIKTREFAEQRARDTARGS